MAYSLHYWRRLLSGDKMHGEENHLINPLLCPLFYLIQPSERRGKQTLKESGKGYPQFIDRAREDSRRRRRSRRRAAAGAVCEFARAFPVSYLRYCSCEVGERALLFLAVFGRVLSRSFVFDLLGIVRVCALLWPSYAALESHCQQKYAVQHYIRLSKALCRASSQQEPSGAGRGARWCIATAIARRKR